MLRKQWQQDDKKQLIVEATSAGGRYKPRRRRLHLDDERRSMTSPEAADVITIVGRSQGQRQGRRRNNCTLHTQLSPEVKRRRAVTSSNSAMTNCEPHGFVFDHVGRRPASGLRRVKSSATGDARPSFRLPSLRSSIFSGNKNRQQHEGRETSRKFGSGTSVDKTPSSGVFSSLFGRQVDKSQSIGDLWVDVDLERTASPPLDNLSVTSADWMAAETAVAGRHPEVDRSANVGEGPEGHVAILRRSNSARPATRRPLPMRVLSVPESRAEPLSNGCDMPTEHVFVPDADLWTPRVNSHNNARLSGDSGHVSYCSAASVSDDQEQIPMVYQEAPTQQVHSADSHGWQRCTAQQSHEEMPTRNQDQIVVVSSCSLSNSTSNSDRRQPSHLPLPPYHTRPTAVAPAAATDMRQYSRHRVVSSSTSDVQSAVDPASRVVCPPQVLSPHPPPGQEWSQSLTRGSMRAAEERLGTWTSTTAMASSMPSIPRECGQGGDTSQTAVEPTISTKVWLDSLHNKNDILSTSQSTDRMYAVSYNPAGRFHSLDSGSGLGSLGRRSAEGYMTPSQSTLAGSDESFATAASSRHSLNSRDSVSSHECQNGRKDSLSSKKRRVRFELQPTSVQHAPDQRQRSRSRSDKRHVGDHAVGTDGVLTADDDAEGRTTSRASGSLFSKFRRVVVDGVGSLFGLSKQKNNVEELSSTHPTCNGHMAASLFDDMSEMERLATVADRIASERLHSAVLHGKLPTQNGYQSGSRLHGCPKPSLSVTDMENVEASFAGLSISSVRDQPQQLPSQKQQQLLSRRGNSSSSVSEELCRLPSSAFSSHVQFVPKSMTVPCSIGSTSDVEPPSSCRKPAASSSMGNVVLIQCQCGSRPMTESEPVLPTTNSSNTSRTVDSQLRGGAYNSDNRRMQANSQPYAEHSVLKSAPQPTTLNTSQGQVWQHSSETAAAKQDVELHQSTSDASRVREKPQPPLKLCPRPSTTSFREGLLPTSVGVEDFRIRRQVGATNHGSQNGHGPMKATVPYLKQSNNGNYMSRANTTRLQPTRPTRSFAAADVCGLSTESDTEVHKLTLQELSALVDHELRANERLEMNSDVVETRQSLNPTAQCCTTVSNHVDSFGVISSSTCSRKPAVQSKGDVDAQLKSLGFDEAIWNVDLDEILDGDKKLSVSDDEEEDSASTLTDCSGTGSVVTVTTMPENRLSTSPVRSGRDQLHLPNDTVDAISGCGSVESVHSVDDPFCRSSKLSTLGSSSSYSLPAISDVIGAMPVDGDPSHCRCCSTNIRLARTCREDVRGRWGLPVAFSFNQLASGTTAVAACSPYNSKSSGIGSLFDSGSVPNSPLWPSKCAVPSTT